LQIFWKLHDRITWKLVNFCNIKCWIQLLTFCLKISSRCGATLRKHSYCVMLKSICTLWINDSSCFSTPGNTYSCSARRCIVHRINVRRPTISLTTCTTHQQCTSHKVVDSLAARILENRFWYRINFLNFPVGCTEQNSSHRRRDQKELRGPQ